MMAQPRAWVGANQHKSKGWQNSEIARLGEHHSMHVLWYMVYTMYIMASKTMRARPSPRAWVAAEALRRKAGCG